MMPVDDESFVSTESLVEEEHESFFMINTPPLSSSVIKEFPSSFSDSDDLIMEVEALFFAPFLLISTILLFR